ncbi:hypothetical protein L9F63_000866 [Diploptera punctata]|uniref:Malate dehydrogenase n=1 Tax=Diploptera punctata TaxID=6984 RepID=A0AAD8ESS6_DIPPU|nr:hypothetical protein L9F63_000866 [Diploptera punctata]
MHDDISSAFFDLEMRQTTAAFLKQNLSPYCPMSLYETQYYSACNISPRQLPSKPFKKARNSRCWVEAKMILTHLSKLEVQYYNVRRDEIARFMFECLTTMKVNKEYARILVDALVNVDLNKEFGEALYRLLLYVADLLDESCNGSAKPKILKSNDVTAWVDGMHTLGPVIGKFCMDMAIKKAKLHGIGIIITKNSNYLGKCTWFTKKAMQKGLIGLAFSNTAHALCPTRAKQSYLGWNPVALSAPASKRINNFSLEVKSTALSLRQVVMCINRGQELPMNCAYDGNAALTTDPKDALYEGCMLPLGGLEETGGYKGYALAIVVEIMCGIFGDSLYGDSIKRALERGREPTNLGHCFIAINPNHFAGNFKKRMDDFAKSIRKIKPINANEPVIYPSSEVDKYMPSCVTVKNRLRYRLVDLMAAYQLSCILNVPPLVLK